MRDLTMFCNDGDCPCEELCCQECNERINCPEDKKCENLRWKEKIYSSPEFQAEKTEELAIREDNWIILVAAERIRADQVEIAVLKAETAACLGKLTELLHYHSLPMFIKDDIENFILTSTGAGAKLAERVKKLERVAEAAKLYVISAVRGSWDDRLILYKELKETVAELEGGNEDY